MKVNLKRTALNVSTYCNLKCKHCLAFIPYYKDKKHMLVDEAVKILSEYFKLVDFVDNFTVTGGEPLLNSNIYDILKEVYKYNNQILKTIDFVTNGTIEISDNILDLFEENKEKTKIVLSDYGNNLSKKISCIKHKLEKRGINYRISKFYGDDLYYDGWIDFSDHSKKWFPIEERDTNAQKCVHRVGKYFVINEGEIHCCSRSFWRIKNNIIPKIKGEYVPLMDERYSIEEKRKMLLEMYSLKSSSSCAYCVGLSNDVTRVNAAQQI